MLSAAEKAARPAKGHDERGEILTSRPWLKFYPQDWIGDPKLRACSLAARGLWLEMMALAHEAVPYGHVLVNDTPPDAATLGGTDATG